MEKQGIYIYIYMNTHTHTHTHTHSHIIYIYIYYIYIYIYIYLYPATRCYGSVCLNGKKKKMHVSNMFNFPILVDTQYSW